MVTPQLPANDMPSRPWIQRRWGVLLAFALPVSAIACNSPTDHPEGLETRTSAAVCSPPTIVVAPQTLECSGVTTQVTLDPVVTSSCDATPIVTFDNGLNDVDPDQYPLGGTAVTITAMDDIEGYSSEERVAVTVLDTTAPVVNSQPNLNAECDSPLGTAVDLPAPDVTDTCDNDPTVTVDAPELFELGVTTVTTRAIDSWGNESVGTYSVLVTDTTPPTLTAGPDLVVPNASDCDGGSGTLVTVPNPEASDACSDDDDLAVFNDVTGDATTTFCVPNDTTTTVTWSAVDAAGLRTDVTIDVTTVTASLTVDVTASADGTWTNSTVTVDAEAPAAVVPAVWSIVGSGGPDTPPGASSSVSVEFSTPGVYCPLSVSVTDNNSELGVDSSVCFGVEQTTPTGNVTSIADMGVAVDDHRIPVAIDSGDSDTWPIYLVGEPVPVTVEATDLGSYRSGIANITLIANPGTDNLLVGDWSPPQGGFPAGGPSTISLDSCNITTEACRAGTLDLLAVGEGDHTLELTTTDAAGNLHVSQRYIRVLRFDSAMAQTQSWIDGLLMDVSTPLAARSTLAEASDVLNAAERLFVESPGYAFVLARRAWQLLDDAEGNGGDTMFLRQFVARAVTAEVRRLIEATSDASLTDWPLLDDPERNNEVYLTRPLLAGRLQWVVLPDDVVEQARAESDDALAAWSAGLWLEGLSDAIVAYEHISVLFDDDLLAQTLGYTPHDIPQGGGVERFYRGSSSLGWGLNIANTMVARIERLIADNAVPAAAVSDLEQVRDLLLTFRMGVEAVNDPNFSNEFLLRNIYLTAVEALEVIDDLEESVIYTHEWRTGLAYVLAFTLNFSIYEGQTALVNQPFTDMDPQVQTGECRYDRGIRALVGSNIDDDDDAVVNLFLGSKCLIIDIYNRYYGNAANFSRSNPVDPADFGCDPAGVTVDAAAECPCLDGSCCIPGDDSDSDGVEDCNDACPDDPAKTTTAGACGCGEIEVDSDNDGTFDCDDQCPGDINKTQPGNCGCGEVETDTDSDGAADCVDACPNDFDKISPGQCGCGTVDIDGDSDGVADCLDACPGDGDKDAPGFCGCGVPDNDSDSDGTFDCNDGCPSDTNKTTSGVCGCGNPDEDVDDNDVIDCIQSCPPTAPDTDGDGTRDCEDGCPMDVGKIEAGFCGCGTPDTDSDSDGTPDCVDQCPGDAGKVGPGECGCGVPDTDSDSDGVGDCNDGCPADTNKVQPGECGCGQSDADDDGDGVPLCNDGCPADTNKVAPGLCGCGTPDGDDDDDGVPNCLDACPNDATRVFPTTPFDAVCDGDDSDCDGVFDEDWTPVSCSEGAPGKSPCIGMSTCIDGVFTPCSPGDEIAPLDVTCNDFDEDCDGVVDDDYVETSCGTCGCAAVSACVGGVEQACVPLAPQTEVCDGLDNNCDCVADEGLDDDLDGYGKLGTESCMFPGADCDDTDPLINPGATEVCDTVDNDCDCTADTNMNMMFCDDGDVGVDENVKNACGDCRPGCNVTNVGNCDECVPFDPDDDNSDGVEENPDGALQLVSTSVDVRFAWVANYQQGTVSKFDLVTGDEVGRYPSKIDGSTNGSPSRTAVDTDGNVWVGNRNRNDGGITKIGNWSNVCDSIISRCQCVDRNDDGVITTSRDVNGDGRIDFSSSAEYKGADDECVLFTVRPHPSQNYYRAVAIDPLGFVWVGNWHQSMFYKLDPSDGSTVQEVDTSNWKSYGAIVDSNGILWSVNGCCGGGRIFSIDTATGEVGPRRRMPWSNRGNYGITVDANNRVWVGSYPQAAWSAAVYDPGPAPYNLTDTGDWDLVPSTCQPSSGLGRGLTVDINNVLWVAQHGGSGNSCDGGWHGGRLTGYDLEDNFAVVKDRYTNPSCRIPVGVGIGDAGDIWAVCNNTSNNYVMTPDPADTSFETYPAGSRTYTYSDFTGNILRTFTAPMGTYSLLEQSCPDLEQDLEDFGVLSWNGSVPAGSRIEFQIRGADTLDDLAGQPFSGPYVQTDTDNDSPVDLSGVPTGDYFEIEVTLLGAEGGITPILDSLNLTRYCSPKN